MGSSIHPNWCGRPRDVFPPGGSLFPRNENVEYSVPKSAVGIRPIQKINVGNFQTTILLTTFRIKTILFLYCLLTLLCTSADHSHEWHHDYSGADYTTQQY